MRTLVTYFPKVKESLWTLKEGVGNSVELKGCYEFIQEEKEH